MSEPQIQDESTINDSHQCHHHQDLQLCIPKATHIHTVFRNMMGWLLGTQVGELRPGSDLLDR